MKLIGEANRGDFGVARILTWMSSIKRKGKQQRLHTSYIAFVYNQLIVKKAKDKTPLLSYVCQSAFGFQ